MRHLSFVLALLAGIVVACGEVDRREPTSTRKKPDAGVTDAGLVDTDGGADEEDGGEIEDPDGGPVEEDGGDAKFDAGAEPDGGTEPEPDGGDPADAGEEPADGGPDLYCGDNDPCPDGYFCVIGFCFPEATDGGMGGADGGSTDDEPRVRIELSWSESYGDVDLHYVGPGGQLYQTPNSSPKGDLYWIYSPISVEGSTVTNNTNATPPPDWGFSNTVSADGIKTNDPKFEVDHVWGKGPVVVLHPDAFHGTYKVYAHYYCSRRRSSLGTYSGTYGAATARIKIFLNGTLRFDEQKSLTQRDVWEAASITFSLQTGESVTKLNTPVYKLSNANNQACTADGD